MLIIVIPQHRVTRAELHPSRTAPSPTYMYLLPINPYIMTTLFHAATVAAKECASLMDPSFVNLFFSFIILIGILISYLPQHHRIISRGTSEGISPLFLLLGVTSGTCTLANILILSRGVLGCCGKGIGAFNCFAASLGVVQVGMQWTGFAVM